MSEGQPPAKRAVFPIIGTVAGLGMLLGFGWMFVTSVLDLNAFPEVPREVTVAEAVAKADPGRGAWVKLTDLRLPCAIEASTPEASSYTYRIGTGSSGAERLVIGTDGPLPCSEEPVQVVGTLSSSTPGRIVGVEFAGLDWKSWPTPYQITLWTFGGPENAKTGLWIGPIFALLGLVMVWFYARQLLADDRRRSPQQG